MDAIMIALVAVALANADGRAGSLLARLLAERGDRRFVIAAAFGSFIANALFAAALGAAANRMIGQGVVALLVALALLGAAVALLWRWPAARDDDPLLTAPAPLLAGRLLAAQFGDRSHVLIGALAATSGAGIWAAAGGLVGWTLAMLPFLAFGPRLAEQRPARIVKLFAIAILALWAAQTGLRAFGLIGGTG